MSGHIQAKQSLKGRLNNKEIRIYPELEDLEVTPNRTTQTFKSSKYGYDDVTVNAIPNEYVIPEGTLNVTENGIYDVTNYASANVTAGEEEPFVINTSYTGNTRDCGPAAKHIIELDFKITVQGCKFLFYNFLNLEKLTLEFTNKPTSMYYMLGQCTKLKDLAITGLDLSVCTDVSGLFTACKELISLPLLDLKNVTSMSQLCYYCTNLVNVPIFDIRSATIIDNMFYACNNLSNESLNNIMAMCISATSYTGNKTLNAIGLNSDQARTCQGLSNYSAFTAAGWTTGY